MDSQASFVPEVTEEMVGEETVSQEVSVANISEVKEERGKGNFRGPRFLLNKNRMWNC